MKKQRLIIRSVILLLLLGALGYTLYTNFFVEKEIVGPNDPAPNFALEDLEGKVHHLSDYKGKGVFLNFWGTYCKPCEKEMPYMNKLYGEYKEKGVEILAANVGESNLAVQKFQEKYDLKFPILMDKDQQVLDAYGVDPIPTTFLIDKNGKITKIITATMTEEQIRAHMESIKP